jgi:hypothetical protein
MSRHYQYYAMVDKYYPSVEDPSIVARQWTDDEGYVHEEVYTLDLKWVPDNTVHRVSTGQQDGAMHPINEEAGLRFEEIQTERVRSREPEDGKYDYYAIVDDGFPLDSPRKVIRTWRSKQGFDLEQEYTHKSAWRRSDVLYRISTDRENGEPIPITEEAAERFEDIMAERIRRAQPRHIDYRYYAIVPAGHTIDDPLTVVRQWDDTETGSVGEEQYSTELRWEASDLLRPGSGEAVPVDEAAADRFRGTQYQRYRRAAGLD